MRSFVLLPGLLLIGVGCSVAEPGPDDSAAGTGGQPTGAAGTPGLGGALGVAGSASPTAGQQGTGGPLGAGGTAPSAGSNSGGGGAATGGSSNGGSSNGGSSSGGAAGAAGTSSGGSSGTAPKPSAGCGKAAGAVGSSGSPLTVSGHQYYVKLPTAYDTNKPYPVLFVFHPTGNPIDWAEKNAGYEATSAKDNAIRVYPASANNSSGWVASDVAFFTPLYDKVAGDYCIDKARAFAAGESSGGDFSSILGCEHADKLRAIAPCATKDVPQYPLNASTRQCTGQVAAIIIHGKNDNVVGPANGPKTRDFYAALNHCGTMTTPVAGYTDTLSNCVAYQGCDAPYPVYWCQHTDPNYSNTNHGWPAFAGKMSWETFSKY
jgi:poly(3-hydroxybutyrate) depolymerase